MTRLAFAALLAFGVVSSAQDVPYRRIQVPGKDVCIAWEQRAYTYTPDAAGSAQTPGEDEFAAIDASFATWQAVSDKCSDFTFLPGARMPNTVFGYDRRSATNTNIVVFREVACRDVVPQGDPCLDDGSCTNAYRCWDHGDFTIALTVTTFTSRTGTILDADIELNAAPHVGGSRFLFTTVPSPPCQEGNESPDCVATDLQNTLTHEIGHALGLDHVSLLGSTMEATAPLGETRKRIVDVGTYDGFCDIYPRGLPANDCFQTGQISPHIVAESRGTPGFGCSAVPAEAAEGAALALCWLAERCLRGRQRRRVRLSAGSPRRGGGTSRRPPCRATCRPRR